MPELPEVEVVRRGLVQHLVGRQVGGVAVLHPRAVRRQPGGAAELAALLAGRHAIDAQRRGKFLWVGTDQPGLVLAAHLGMSGQFRVARTGAPDHTHVRVRFDLSDGCSLSFVDQRTFGWVAATRLVIDRHGRPVPEMVAGIGLDPADDSFDPGDVARTVRGRRVEIKRLLLDQAIVSGIGNIYADEALWRARVHPRLRCDRLPVARVASVLQAAAQVMEESLRVGGTSFDSLYVNVNGRSGYFSRRLSVYGRTGAPCPRCGAAIRRESFMNRSSHFCPRCQREPRARD